jgi:hypothetical protein
VRDAIARALPDAILEALSPTTWVVASASNVRPLLAAIVDAVSEGGGPALVRATRMHARRTRRGTSADESLLQGLVRSRHALPARLATARGVSGVQNPLGG